MGSYCACALSCPPPELSIRGAGQKDRSSGDENGVLRNLPPNVTVWNVEKGDLSKGYPNPKRKLGGNHAFFFRGN